MKQSRGERSQGVVFLLGTYERLSSQQTPFVPRFWMVRLSPARLKIAGVMSGSVRRCQTFTLL